MDGVYTFFIRPIALNNQRHISGHMNNDTVLIASVFEK